MFAKLDADKDGVPDACEVTVGEGVRGVAPGPGAGPPTAPGGGAPVDAGDLK